MKKRAFIKYTEYGKIIPGSMIVTQGSFPSREGRAKWYEVPINKCCSPAEVFDLERFLSRMNSCYTQVTNLVPRIIYFSDYSSEQGVTSISDGCNDMYDGGNLYNTNLTQLYNDIKDGNTNYDLSIPYTHTQDDGTYENCDYTNTPMNGYIGDGTNYFGAGSTYVTNMYPGMFMLAATGVNVTEFSITGDIGSDGDGIDVVYIETAHPGWTAFIKTNYDSSNDDPSLNHIILVYGNISGTTQLYDNTGEQDDHCIQGLGSTNTAIISLVVATENGTPALTKEEALAIANKTLDVYNSSACNPPQALRLLYSSDQFPPNGVADPENVNDWNDYFDLPTYGNPFTSVTVNTQEDGSIWINLYGGSNITLRDYLFEDSGNGILLKALDDAGCIVAFGNSCFLYQPELNQVSFPACTSILDEESNSDYGTFGYCYKLTNINFPVLQSAGVWTFYTTGCKYFNLPELTTVTGEGTFYQEENIGNVEFNLPKLQNVSYNCFYGADSISINLPSVTTVDYGGFSSCNIQSISLPIATTIGDAAFVSNTPVSNLSIPSCTSLGSTVGDDGVFNGITGFNITLTLPSALMTCDAGQPDGDIVYLQDNNTLTIITT